MAGFLAQASSGGVSSPSQPSPRAILGLWPGESIVRALPLHSVCTAEQGSEPTCLLIPSVYAGWPEAERLKVGVSTCADPNFPARADA